MLFQPRPGPPIDSPAPQRRRIDVAFSRHERRSMFRNRDRVVPSIARILGAAATRSARMCVFAAVSGVLTIEGTRAAMRLWRGIPAEMPRLTHEQRSSTAFLPRRAAVASGTRRRAGRSPRSVRERLCRQLPLATGDLIVGRAVAVCSGQAAGARCCPGDDRASFTPCIGGCAAGSVSPSCDETLEAS